jgi:hypothetical protein
MILRKKALGSISGTKALNILLGATTMVYKAPLFFLKTFIILGIQPMVAFCLSTIFYESGGTLGMVTMLDESLIMIEVPHNNFEANQKTNTQESILSFKLPPS